MQLRKLQMAIAVANDNLDYWRRQGDKRREREALDKYNEAVYLRDRLMQELNDNRRMAAKALLKCFVMCDLLDELADEFGEILNRISYGTQSADNDFVQLCRRLAREFRPGIEQAETLPQMLEHCKAFCRDANGVVTVIDSGGSQQVSLYYADVAEELTGKVKQVLDDGLTAVMATARGTNYF